MPAMASKGIDTMAESLFDRIYAFLSKKSAVQRVAEDPAMAAELLLLMHVVFADGDQHPAEIAAFKEIAFANFGISAEELSEVTEYLKDYAYETNTRQAAAMLAEMAPERRVALLRDLMTVACSDNDFDEAEAALINRVAQVLNVSPQELQEANIASKCDRC